MSVYNVLILSAGRRVELINLFKQAANELDIRSNIVAGDCSEHAPAIYFADKRYMLPRISASNYIDEIIDVCKKESIKLVVPTIDTDLLILSQQKNRIYEESGAIVLISSTEVISTCRDKILSQQYLEKKGFLVPKLYSLDGLNKDALSYPLFIKPKSGSSSEGTFKVNNRDELDLYLNVVKDPMLQDYMEGEEYTVDVFLDFSSNIVTVVPRLRMEVRTGEISKGKVVKDPDIINDVIRLMSVLKPIGHITVQLMKTKKGIEYIEINPRFGGGAPMSIHAGANSCENLYRLLMDEKIEYNENYKDQLVFLRYDQSIIIKDGEIYND